jgi:CspA family cold shock protein
MSKGNEYRAPRRRGFNDEFTPPPFERRDARPPSRPAFAPSSRGPAAPASGPAVAATVKWFNPTKGFGFVELADGSGDAFLHAAVLQSAGHESVAAGAKLQVQVGQGAKGAQVAAVLEVDESSASGDFAPRAPKPAQRGRPTIDPANATEIQGSVKWFNSDKGFGFVACEDGMKDVFVHVSVLTAAGIQRLAEGQRVSMRVVETPKGREAVSIEAI